MDTPAVYLNLIGVQDKLLSSSAVSALVGAARLGTTASQTRV